jgi:hypothetical protein
MHDRFPIRVRPRLFRRGLFPPGLFPPGLFRLAAWLAFVATLSGAIAPAVSQALAGTSADLCLSTDAAPGSVALEPGPSSGPASSPASNPHGDHGPACPFCLSHGASSAAPPPSPPAHAMSPGWRAPACAGRAAASAAPARWITASPRGPPPRA